MNLDQILESRVGFGKTQILVMLIAGLVQMNDGAQFLSISLQNPIIEKQWSLKTQQVSLMTSIFYLGMVFGSLICGKFTDQFGRKPLLISGAVIQILVSSTFLWVNNYPLLLICRFLYGFGTGFTIALTTTIYAQFSPPKQRGKGILFINSFASFGKLFGVLISLGFLQNFQSGNWRMVMFLCCVPSMIVLVLSIPTLTETPRFLLAHEKYEEAFEVINSMMKRNHSQEQYTELSYEQREGLINWSQSVFNGDNKNHICAIFTRRYVKVTIFLAICWFCISFIYFGQLTMLPYFLKKQQKSLKSYLISICGELPSLIINFFLIDRPGFGRKNVVIGNFIFSGIFNLMFSFWSLTIISSICRFFMKNTFQMIYPLTTQSYDSLSRGLGFGFNSAVGRSAVTIMPFIVIPLVKHNPYMVSILFMIICLVGAISACMIPETLNKPIDGEQENYENVQEQIQ